MKKTNSYLVLPNGKYISKEGREMLEGFRLTFNLSVEDWEYFKNKIVPAIDHGNDYADCLLAMLTYGIHCAYKDIEKKDFIYDFEREKPQA